MRKLKKFIEHVIRSYGVYYWKQRSIYANNKFESLIKSKERVDLASDGIVSLVKLPPELLNYLLELNEKDKDVLKFEVDVAPGLKERLVISLANKQLQNYLSKHIFPVIDGYRGKHYVMRGNPRIVNNVKSERMPADHFHMDFGLHQLTLQILLSDVSKDSIHMEYIKGSHNSSWFNLRATLFPIKDPARLLPNSPRVELIGNSGKAYLFDAGNGFHRAVTNCESLDGRKVLSVNFTALTHTDLVTDFYENYSKLENVIDPADKSIYKSFN